MMLFNITKPCESWKLQKAFSDVSKIRYNKLNSKVQILCTCMYVIDSYFFTKAIALLPIFHQFQQYIIELPFFFRSLIWKGKVPSFLPTYLLTMYRLHVINDTHEDAPFQCVLVGPRIDSVMDWIVSPQGHMLKLQPPM